FRDACHVHDFAVVRKENLTVRRGDGSQNAARGRGFSTPALADQRQCLSAIEEEGHVVDRLHMADGLLQKAPANGEVLLEPPDIEEHGAAWTGVAAAHCCA